MSLENEKRNLTIKLITLMGVKNTLKRRAIQKRLDEINKLLKGQK